MSKKETKISLLYRLIGVVVALWIGSWFIVNWLNDNAPEQGQFGDKFGFVNSLFSGLALAGIIFSIILQRDELYLQRQELQETRREFKQQNFETTFFNLVRNQHEIVYSIKTTITNLTYLTKTHSLDLNGRDFFVYCKRELNRIGTALKHKKFGIYQKEYYENLPEEEEELPPWETDHEAEILTEAKIEYTNLYYSITKENWEKAKNNTEVEIGRKSYAFFFNRYHYVIGHYFRHLYHILKFLDQTEHEEKKLYSSTEDIKLVSEKYQRYAQFVQAQMGTPELLLLFYNCLSFPKLLALCKKYSLLENLTQEDLISPQHLVPGVNFKSRKKLIE
jgi:hypothetical protein